MNSQLTLGSKEVENVFWFMKNKEKMHKLDDLAAILNSKTSM